MNQHDRQDEVLDPLLAGAMQELRDEAGYDVDWDGLRSSINDRAALPLARRRSRRNSFSRRSVAMLATAASIAFALWIGPGVYQEAVQPTQPAELATSVDDDVLMQALTGDLTEAELLRLVYGSPEVLLTVAISPR